MSRKQLFAVLASLIATVLSLAMPPSGEAMSNYCGPVRLCVSSCEDVTENVMACKAAADHACIFLTGECWDSGDTDPYCNSGGYSELICYYSH